jgi:hypothetical protein
MINWLKKILGNEEAPAAAPKRKGAAGIYSQLAAVKAGRYSDNNKTRPKTEKWQEAEDLYKEKRFIPALTAFFEYLRDEEENNVHFEPNGEGFSFSLVQGSGKVVGECDGQTVVARLPLAVMDYPGTAIMRRLLDLNYNLYYSHTALDADNTLYMIFNSSVSSASPDKMYQGLREITVKGDKIDDLLLTDFNSLKRAEGGSITSLTEQELSTKYRYFREWIEAVLTEVDKLNPDSFAGAIAYMLLGTVYRIDFLITPQGKLLSELEAIHRIYWDKKDEVTLVERNKQIKNALRKLLDLMAADFAKSLYYSKNTFAISGVPKSDKVREYINNANKDAQWYSENKYPDAALRLNEYGVLYSQFVYSVPRVQTLLVKIYMAVMHSAFFAEMGFERKLYDAGGNGFDREAIEEAVNESIAKYEDKFPYLKWHHDRVKYNSLYDFGVSFSEQIANLNLETKRH